MSLNALQIIIVDDSVIMKNGMELIFLVHSFNKLCMMKLDASSSSHD